MVEKFPNNFAEFHCDSTGIATKVFSLKQVWFCEKLVRKSQSFPKKPSCHLSFPREVIIRATFRPWRNRRQGNTTKKLYNTERVTLHFAKRALQPDMHNLIETMHVSLTMQFHFGMPGLRPLLATNSRRFIGLSKPCAATAWWEARRPAIPHRFWRCEPQASAQAYQQCDGPEAEAPASQSFELPSLLWWESNFPSYNDNMFKDIILYFACPNIKSFHNTCLYFNSLMIYHHISIPCRPPKK